MILFRVLGNSFQKWFRTLGMSTIASLIGAINPVFLIGAYYTFFLSQNKFDRLITQPDSVISSYVLVLTLMNFFPSVFASIAMQTKLIEDDTITMKEYFAGFWKIIRRSLLPTLGLFLFYLIICILMLYTGIFYYKLIPSMPLKISIILFIVSSFLVFVVTIYLFLPMFISEEKRMKTSTIIKYAMEISIRNFLPMSAIFLVDMILFLGLSLAYCSSIFIYFGLSSYIKTYLFYEIISKYAGSSDGRRPVEPVKVGNSPSPWLDLLKEKKEILLNKDKKPEQ